jgi:hypothetical protein
MGSVCLQDLKQGAFRHGRKRHYWIVVSQRFASIIFTESLTGCLVQIASRVVARDSSHQSVKNESLRSFTSRSSGSPEVHQLLHAMWFGSTGKN